MSTQEERQVTDAHGRVWTISRVREEDAEEADFRFWYENLTPEQRVDAVAEALLSCLQAKGIDAIPRLRRVHRRIKSPWSKLAIGPRIADELSDAEYGDAGEE